MSLGPERTIETEGTLPSPDVIYGPDDEDYVNPEERAELVKVFQPGSLHRFKNEAELYDYVNAMREASAEPPTEPESEGGGWVPTSGQVILLALSTAAIGAFVGWLWRKHREEKALEAKGITPLHPQKSVVGSILSIGELGDGLNVFGNE